MPIPSLTFCIFIADLCGTDNKKLAIARAVRQPGYNLGRTINCVLRIEKYGRQTSNLAMLIPPCVVQACVQKGENSSPPRRGAKLTIEYSENTDRRRTNNPPFAALTGVCSGPNPEKSWACRPSHSPDRQLGAPRSQDVPGVPRPGRDPEETRGPEGFTTFYTAPPPRESAGP